jgi:hypothetical protein
MARKVTTPKAAKTKAAPKAAKPSKPKKTPKAAAVPTPSCVAASWRRSPCAGAARSGRRRAAEWGAARSAWRRHSASGLWRRVVVAEAVLPCGDRIAAALLDCMVANKAKLASIKQILDVKLDSSDAANWLKQQAAAYRQVDDESGAIFIIEQVNNEWSLFSRYWAQVQRQQGVPF